jgi:NADH dehydrogenase FAD-containing subunit
VEKTLQLSGYPNIFAIGDIIDCDVEKLAQNAEIHAKLVASNIKALDSGRPLSQYHPSPKMMLISMGPKRCLLSTSETVLLEGYSPRYLKDAVEKKVMLQFN